MGITFEQRDESSLIGLEGVVDIAFAAQLKNILLNALKSGKAVRVALDHSTELDVTALQLLWATEREARATGVEFSLAGPVPQPVSAALKDAGFDSFPVPV